MFIQKEFSELPISNVPQYFFKPVPYKNRVKYVNPYQSICCNGLVQVFTGMLRNNRETSLPALLFFPKHLSLFEVYNLPTFQALLSIGEEAWILVNSENDPIGLCVKRITDGAIKAYDELCRSGDIDMCIQEVFRKPDTPKNLVPNNVVTYEFVDKTKTFSDKSIDLLLCSHLYLYLASEVLRDGSAYSIPLFGWSMEEIEKSNSIKNMHEIFSKLFFWGFYDNNQWYSTHLTVTKPHKELIDLISFSGK